ncbi:MAG: hypothetical protein HPZ91_06030 [Lentisphaeria bacterium]|nr:hypothetical protein [Lentisphaeria bacterium]
MVDPDKINQDNAPAEDSDDTKTRKTVRLRPSVTPAGINLTPMPKVPLTDPLSGRDTDTGNLEVMEDTQTRRTVKLTPIATQTGPAIQPKIPVVQKAAGDGANTQTRKTIVLKPTAVSPASVKVDSPTGAAPAESDDTKTRKTVRLRPSAVTPSQVKIAPGAEPGEASEVESSDTIKISRPVRPGGMIPPKVPVPGAAADPSKATMVLPGRGPVQPQSPGAAPTPSHSLPVAKPLPSGTVRPEVTPQAAPQPVPTIPTPKKDDDEILQLKPTGSANSKLPGGDVKVAEGKEAEEKSVAAPKPMAAAESAGSPSRFYLVLAAVSLVLIAVTLTLTTVQYLNMWEQQSITLPLAPQAK